MRALLAAALLVPSAVLAVEYECKVERKVDQERVYSDEQLRKGKFSARIRDDGKTATISRCSYAASEQKVTCDSYDVDKVADDETWDQDGDKWVTRKIKKYYRFRGQYDVQVFPDLSFVENNGRGGIAYGRCRVVSP
jgi:hypothetical protein